MKKCDKNFLLFAIVKISKIYGLTSVCKYQFVSHFDTKHHISTTSMNPVLFSLVFFTALANSLDHGSGEVTITDEISGSGEAQITDFKSSHDSESKITFIVDLDDVEYSDTEIADTEKLDTENLDTNITKNKSTTEEESCDAEDDIFEELEPVLENDLQLEDLEDLVLNSIKIETFPMIETTAATTTTTPQLSTTTELEKIL